MIRTLVMFPLVMFPLLPLDWHRSPVRPQGRRRPPATRQPSPAAALAVHRCASVSASRPIQSAS